MTVVHFKFPEMPLGQSTLRSAPESSFFSFSTATGDCASLVVFFSSR